MSPMYQIDADQSEVLTISVILELADVSPVGH